MYNYMWSVVMIIVVIWTFSFTLIGFILLTAHEPPKHLVIYVAGKYSGTPDEIKTNVNNAILAGQQVLLKCNYALVSHTFYYFNVKAPNTFWYQINDLALAKADGIVIISISNGVEGEIKFAQDHKIPMYFGVDQIPNTCNK